MDSYVEKSLVTRAAIASVVALAMITLSGCGARYKPLARAARPPGEPVPPAEQIVREFKALHRPIIERYDTHHPGAFAVLWLGDDDYDRVVLTDEADTFIKRYTLEELALAIGPLLLDDYWNGDALAVLWRAQDDPCVKLLCDAGYQSPDSRGCFRGRLDHLWISGLGRYDILNGRPCLVR